MDCDGAGSLALLAQYLVDAPEEVFGLVCSEYGEAQIRKIVAAAPDPCVGRAVLERWRSSPLASVQGPPDPRSAGVMHDLGGGERRR